MRNLAQIYRDIQPKIFAFFYVRTSHQSVAEDLTHDVFYEACKNIHQFKGKSSVQTWVFSIANNLLKKHYRSRKYQRNLTKLIANEPQGKSKSPEEELLIHEETRQLMKQIEVLDDLQKEIILLRIYGELTFQEIGQVVGKSENYTRVTFHRMKIRLQQEMEEEK